MAKKTKTPAAKSLFTKAGKPSADFIKATNQPFKGYATVDGMARVNLYGPGISYSILSQKRRCPEHARIQYLLGLKAPFDSYSAEFGTAFHAANAYRVRHRLSPEKACKRYILEWTNEWGDSPIPPDVAKEFDEMMQEVEVILEAYAEHWDAADKEIDWLLREEWLHVPYALPLTFYHPDQWTRDVNILPLHGILDGMYRRPVAKSDRKLIVIRDTKTVNSIATDRIEARLLNDLQAMMYLEMANCVLAPFNEKVNLFQFDLVRRPSIRQTKTETRDEFLVRLAKDIRARPDTYYARVECRYFQRDIELWRKRVFHPLLYQFDQWLRGMYANCDYYLHPENFLTLHDDPFVYNRHHYLNDAELVHPIYGVSPYLDFIQHGKAETLVQRKPRVPVVNLTNTSTTPSKG